MTNVHGQLGWHMEDVLRFAEKVCDCILDIDMRSGSFIIVTLHDHTGNGINMKLVMLTNVEVLYKLEV